MTTFSLEEESSEVSVVIPCYNQGKFLGEAIDSVLNQKISSVEIIVVNDGSPDNTTEITLSYNTSLYDIEYLTQKNLGRSSARNVGLAVSRGRYIVFLDADDRLLPTALETGLSHFRNHSGCAFVSGTACYIDEDGFVTGHLPTIMIYQDDYTALLHSNYTRGIHTIMFRRDVLEEVGGFDSSLPSHEDYDLYLRIAKKFPVFHHGELVAEYRHHGENTSRNAPLALVTRLSVLRSQWQYAKNVSRLRKNPRCSGNGSTRSSPADSGRRRIKGLDEPSAGLERRVSPCARAARLCPRPVRELRDAYNSGVRRTKRLLGTDALVQYITGEVRALRQRGGDTVTPSFLTVLRLVPGYLPKAVLKALLPAPAWNRLRSRWRALTRSGAPLP